MTRLERKEEELKKLYEYRAAALRRNDGYWLCKNQKKIDDLEKEVIECRRHAPMKLSDALKEYGDDVKNDIYKRLLRISLLSDVVTQACLDCKCALRKVGLDDFSFRADVDEIDRLSKRIANIVLVTGNATLEDFIVDNEDVIDRCYAEADRYLNKKLNL